MAKFTQSQLDRIKRELKIKDLAEQAGIQLARKNGQFVTRCLWHDDNDPSLFIHPGKNLFNCFGCSAGGDVFEWMMKREGKNFNDAVHLILERYPHLKEEIETVSPEKVKAETCPLDMEVSDQKFLQQVIEFYHQRLVDDYAAQDYLMKRGILDNEAIKVHQIGFADRDLGRIIPNAQRKLGKDIRTRLADLGIYRRKTGHGHFNGCIVFPIIDPQGNIREIYGRRVNDHTYAKEPTPISIFPRNATVRRSRYLERTGSIGSFRNHSLRIHHRRDVFLGGRLQERHRHLRNERIHELSLGRTGQVQNENRSASARSRRRRRSGHQTNQQETTRIGNQRLSLRLPEGDQRRQRLHSNRRQSNRRRPSPNEHS